MKVHDFEDKKLGKVAPYGVYDIAADAGWISLGITCDTAEFAVASIRTWLERIGQARYPKAGELTITADCGGSNGSRVRLWKVELQKLADETGLTIKVRHYPPGTSKWNKIEHRLFCRITQTLARSAAHRPRHHHRPHRGDKHQDRAQSRERPRHEDLRERHKGHQGRDGAPRHPRRCVPSRMELLGCSPATKIVAFIVAVVLNRAQHLHARPIFEIHETDLSRPHAMFAGAGQQPAAKRRAAASCRRRGNSRVAASPSQRSRQCQIKCADAGVAHCHVWTAPLVKGFLEALRTSRVRSCLRPVDAGKIAPLALMIGPLGFLAPSPYRAHTGADSLAGFRTCPLAHITPSVTLDCCSPCGE